MLAILLTLSSVVLATLAVRSYRHYRRATAQRDAHRLLALLLWYLAARAQARADMERYK